MCGFKKIPGFDGYVSDCTKGESLFKGDLGPEYQVYPTCDHIIGYTNSPYDGGWLVKDEEDWYFDKPIDDGDDLVFTFCPLCGERLKEE